MELELHFTCRVEVYKYTPAFSEDRPDWGSEDFSPSAEFSVYLGDLDITKELPESELEYIHDKILEDYN
jgi:hypothetical protein